MHYKSEQTPAYNEYEELAPIKIGNDVWIGDDVYVKNGIKIGDGAIIGARSFVTKDVPPYAIVVGCPAKILRNRFDDETIEKLIKLKWWNLDDDIIKSLPYDDVELTIKKLESLNTLKNIKSL